MKDRKVKIKKNAFKRCVNSKEFNIWLNRKIYEAQKGASLEKQIEEMLNPKYLKLEILENNKWIIME